MTVDNYARKLFEYEGMNDIREKGLEQQREELSERNFKNKNGPTFESYSKEINKNAVRVELFLKG
jgi:hypothetical protein